MFHLVRQRTIFERTGDDLVRTYKNILSASIDKIGQIAFFFIPEYFQEAFFYFVRHIFPLFHELIISGLPGQFQGVANSIIPKSIDFHLIASAWSNRYAIDNGIHPGQCFSRFVGPDQTVIHHLHIFVDSIPVSFQNGLHLRPVALPDSSIVLNGFSILLNGFKKPHRSIDRIVGSIFIFTDIREQTVIQLTDHRVENFFTSPDIIRRSQGHSRQSNKGIPSPSSEPGVSCHDLGFFSSSHDKLGSRIFQTTHKAITGSPVIHQFLEFGFQPSGRHRIDRSRKNHTFPFLYRKFEIPRYEQIFPEIISPVLFFYVFDVIIPVGSSDKLVLLADLHIQVWKTIIQFGTDPVFNFLIFGIDHHIRFRQAMDIPVSQERFQSQRRIGMGIQQSITDQDLRFVVYQNNLFFELYASHPVSQGKYRFVLEIDNIFMSPGFIITRILMDTQIKLTSMLDDRLVQVRQQHMILPIEFFYRQYQ